MFKIQTASHMGRGIGTHNLNRGPLFQCNNTTERKRDGRGEVQENGEIQREGEMWRTGGEEDGEVISRKWQ